MNDLQDNPQAAADGPDRDALTAAIRQVKDPDIGISLMDLGLIYDIRAKGRNVEIDMTLTSPACPYGPMLVKQVGDAARSVAGVDSASVELIWDPQWTLDMMPEDLRLEMGLD